MNRLWRECRQADGDIFRAVRKWRAVLHPFSCLSDHCLPGADIQRALLMRHAQRALEHNREFVKLWFLPRLDPSLGTAHVSDTEASFAAVHAANVFIDQLGFVTRGSNASRFCDQNGHMRTESATFPNIRRR